MNSCIDRGLRQEGVLPGGLNVKRRAAKLRAMLEKREQTQTADALIAMDWINAWALAVNEENAAGGKVVTSADERCGRRCASCTALLRSLL